MTSVDDHISKAIDLMNANKVEEAIDEYEKALSIDPDDATALTGLGEALDELGALNDAAESYKKALIHDADDVIAHSGLGVVYEKQGNTDLATREYTLALKLDSETAFMHIVYARDRYTNALVTQKQRLEDKVKGCEHLIEQYTDTTKITDRYISKYFPAQKK